MASNRLIRTGWIATLILASMVGAVATCAAADRREPRPMVPAAMPAPALAPVGEPVQIAASESGSHFVPLGIGKSVVIDLARDVKDVLVADPKIANAVVRSARRVYLIGSAIGQTSIYFFDQDGRQLAGLDIAVTRDLNGVRAALRQMFPESDMRIEGVGDSVVLSGSAGNQQEAQQAFEIAARLVGGDTKVVNGIVVKGRDQVMLKVTVAEVQRDIIKQLGVNLSGSVNSGASSLSFNTDNPFAVNGKPITDSSFIGKFPNVTATLRAMDRAGVIRTLAEPTLTAISGESATFLVGGEFPYPVPGTCAGCPASVDYKKFGVGLAFTPVVMSEGRISLKVMTEVSELSPDNAVSIGGTTVPALKVRRADSTVEIPSGGALVMGGMIKEQTRQAINGIPALLEIPVLGTLFRSRDFVNNQTELMIIVTPFTVRAVARKDLSRPDDGYADASDPSSNLMGRLNRIYGVSGPADPRGGYRGKYGFILD
jgi:pilus assembly protein CpaC